jgi:hypothetical protein
MADYQGHECGEEKVSNLSFSKPTEFDGFWKRTGDRQWQIEYVSMAMR